MASHGCSFIEVGNVEQSSSSVWRHAAVAVAGGAVAGVLLATVAPSYQINNFAPSTSSTANAVFAPVPISSSGVRTVSTPVFAVESEANDSSVYQNSAWQPQAFAPILLATSGLLMVIAAAIRFFRPAQNLEYSMLLATAQQQRQKAMQEKEEAKKREIQERLMRLARMGALPSHISAPAAGAAPVASAAPVTFSSNNEWESRQTQRQQQEQQKEEAKRREIQERLARLAAMGFSGPAPAAASAPKAVQAPAPAPVAAPTGSISDWEQRQQERERREKEKEAAKQREIQERLARLAKLGAAVPEQAPAAVAVEGVNEWERRQQERERREREKAMAAQREIEERMARLARLSSGR